MIFTTQICKVKSSLPHTMQTQCDPVKYLRFLPHRSVRSNHLYHTKCKHNATQSNVSDIYHTKCTHNAHKMRPCSPPLMNKGGLILFKVQFWELTVSPVHTANHATRGCQGRQAFAAADNHRGDANAPERGLGLEACRRQLACILCAVVLDPPGGGR